MNLTGRWKGEYTYGLGYPLAVVGQSHEFIFEIRDIDGKITGICFDDIQAAVPENTAEIAGFFLDGKISFVKTYKYHLVMDENGNRLDLHNVQSNGIHYSGQMRKRLFSRKVYFSGKWQIANDYTTDLGGMLTHSVQGTWSMNKV